MLLHSKEGQFTIAGSRLQKTKSSHHQRQNTTTTNRGGHRQIEGSKVLQETRSYLGLQQCADKRRQQMKNSFPDEQEIIQATDYIFQTMQLTRNIPKDNKQHIQRIASQGSIGKLYEQFCHTSQNDEGIRREDNLIIENCRKTQPLFQIIQIQLQHEEIPILGVVVGKRQVQMEQDKIKVVKEWKMPMKIKKVESFLGFANFYRRFT